MFSVSFVSRKSAWWIAQKLNNLFHAEKEIIELNQGSCDAMNCDLGTR